MPRRGPSEADLYLLYGFASALVFLMGIIIVMRSRGRRMYDVEARGVALDWDGLKHLYRTGTYDVREREAWDSPAARATLTGIPPLKRASKQKRERQERKERRRRRREASDSPRDDLEAGVDVAAAGGSWVEVESGAPRGGVALGLAARHGVGAGSKRLGPGPDRRRDPGPHRPPRRRGPGDVQPAPGRRGGDMRARGPQRGRPGGGRRLRAHSVDVTRFEPRVASMAVLSSGVVPRAAGPR